MDASWTMESTPTRIVRWKDNIVNHVHSERTSRPDRLHFVRRQWWQQQYAALPEWYTPETVPSDFVEKYTNRTEKNIQWVYHTLAWEDRFLERNYSASLDHCLVQHLSHLETEDEKETERRLAKKIFQVVTEDCFKILELLDNKKVTCLYSSPPEQVRRLVWAINDGGKRGINTSK